MNYCFKAILKYITCGLTLLLFTSVCQAETSNIVTMDYLSLKENNKDSKLRPDIFELTQKIAKSNKFKKKGEGQLVLIEAVAKEDPDTLLKDLLTLGLKSEALNGRIISGFFPIYNLSKLDKLASLNEVKLGRTINSQGGTITQGDHAQQSDNARKNFSVSGKDVTIGVISDSYNCLKGESIDKKSKDLPEQAHAVEDAFDCTGARDEGRALMQIIHDVAPSAKLVFFSGSNGPAKTANGILDLAFKYKVDVIMDDHKSLSANIFQKDSISQAVDEVVKAGIVYITAAGNSGRSSYQNSYNEYTSKTLKINAHDFDSSDNVDIYQELNIPEGVGFTLVLQWSSPAYSISGKPGAQTDLDIFILNKSHTEILTSSTFGNIGRDPVEIIDFYNPPNSGKTKFDLMITKASGKSPSMFKYIILNSGEGMISEYQTNSSAIFGHANSESAISVGAANYLDTPAFGVASPLLQYYSSAGGTALTLDLKGNALVPPMIPKKPDIIAPDNVNTTFFGNNDTDNDGKPNIAGSSAATPHVAGIAALLLETNPLLQPVDIKKILQETAIDIFQRKHADGTKTMLETGFDFDSGYGFINAEAAVNLAKTFQPSSKPEPDDGKHEVIIINDLSKTGSGGTIDLLFALLLVTALFKWFYKFRYRA